jgi:hypothetical protein
MVQGKVIVAYSQIAANPLALAANALALAVRVEHNAG